MCTIERHLEAFYYLYRCIGICIIVFIDIMTRGYARVYIQISLNELFSGIHVENQIFMIAKKI